MGFTLCVLQVCAQVQITAYDRGPNGLEAWTDDHHTRLFRKNAEPFGIVVARHGSIVRYIARRDGGPFFWNVMLLPDGKRIAYESGPFHMSMNCTLMDIATGRHLEDVPCFSDKDLEALPAWANDLLDEDRKPPPGFQPSAIVSRKRRTGDKAY